MFPKAIVFLFAVVLAEEAITNRVKREEMEAENDIDNGLAVNENRSAEYWHYRRKCVCCDDVHCQSFDGKPIRLKGVCLKNLMTAPLNDIVQVILETLPKPPSGNKIGDLTIIYNGHTYTIDKHCDVKIDGKPSPPEPVPSEVNIFRKDDGKTVCWRIKQAFFQVCRNCEERCVYVWLAHRYVDWMKGICADNDHDPKDDMDPYPSNNLGYWKFTRDWWLVDCHRQGPYE